MSSQQQAALENYNYWNDGRVQAAMFSSCWKIVAQGANDAVVSFDEEWVILNIYEPHLDEVMYQWAEEGREVALEYKEIKDRHSEASKAEKEFSAIVRKEHGSWDWPEEAKVKLKGLQDVEREEYAKLRAAYQKLYDLAEAEVDQDTFLKSAGFSELVKGKPFCMKVATKFEVCHQCEGSGKVVNPSIDAGGLTYEDFEDDYYEEDGFHERYFRGDYDIDCPTCHGKRVEAMPQFPEQLNKLIEEYNRSEWDHIRETAAERAMGA